MIRYIKLVKRYHDYNAFTMRKLSRLFLIHATVIELGSASSTASFTLFRRLSIKEIKNKNKQGNLKYYQIYFFHFSHNILVNSSSKCVYSIPCFIRNNLIPYLWCFFPIEWNVSHDVVQANHKMGYILLFPYLCELLICNKPFRAF